MVYVHFHTSALFHSTDYFILKEGMDTPYHSGKDKRQRRPMWLPCGFHERSHWLLLSALAVCIAAEYRRGAVYIWGAGVTATNCRRHETAGAGIYITVTRH